MTVAWADLFQRGKKRGGGDIENFRILPHSVAVCSANLNHVSKVHTIRVITAHWNFQIWCATDISTKYSEAHKFWVYSIIIEKLQ